MSTGNWFELLVAILALMIVGVAAWVEISLSNVSQRSIRQLLEDRLTGNRESELNESRSLRTSMLLIELACGAIWSALATHVLVEAGWMLGLAAGVIIATIAVLIVGRIVPSWIAARRQGSVSGLTLRVGAVLNGLFIWLVWPVNLISGSRNQLERDEEDSALPNGVETGDPVEVHGDSNGVDDDEIELDEHHMLTGVLQLDEATAHDVMVPRIDLVALPIVSNVAEAVAVAIGAGHSRIPVYGESVDDIVGILYVKDLLKYVTEEHETVDLKAVIHPSYFVPETKPLDDLLHELQQTKIHMAVVVDEYGGTAGVVTIEDILEEIVGEIEDEFDKKPVQFDIISETEIVVDGRLMVDDITDHFDLHFDERPAGTVSGLIQRELGYIPDNGESIEAYNMELTVIDADRQRIRSVRCVLLSEQDLLADPADESLSSASQ